MRAEYFAGFFDGEGCVSIRRIKGRNPEYALSYVLRLDVGNIEPAPLIRLQALYGGSLSSYQPRGRRTGRAREPKQGFRRMYNWSVQGEEARSFLSDVFPHLIVKAQQAWVALEFMATRAKNGGQYRRVSAEETALREGFRLALQCAKGRLEVEEEVAA